MRRKQPLPPRQGVTLLQVGTLLTPFSEQHNGVKQRACKTTTTSPTPTSTTTRWQTGVAGHHVADDWLQTRAKVEEGLLAAGAWVVEGNPKGSCPPTPGEEDHFEEEAQDDR